MAEPDKTYRIFLSAAEPSGDAHCAGLITALKKTSYNIEFVGAGGPKMAEAGFEVIHVYGLTEVYGPAVVNEWNAGWNNLDISGSCNPASLITSGDEKTSLIGPSAIFLVFMRIALSANSAATMFLAIWRAM